MSSDQSARMHTPRERVDLFETRRGHVFYCPSCKALHAQLGNALMTCGPDEFSRFRQAVKQSCAALDVKPESSGQSHLFCWDSPAMSFVFTAHELLELRLLVEGAAAMLRQHPTLERAFKYNN